MPFISRIGHGFNYCTVAWMFSSPKSLSKIGNLHKRALRFKLDDYCSSHEKILEKSGKYSMHVKRIHNQCTEIYKALNNLNLSFMEEIFELRLCSWPVREQYKLNLNIPRKKQVAFGTKSLEILGLKIWNNLPYHVKSTENVKVFKELIEK